MNQFIKNIQWRSVFVLCVLPIITFYMVYHYLSQSGISWPIVLLSVFFYYATGMSITAGYHRLFSHRTYEASPGVRFFFAFFGSAAFQDSVITWSTDHRYHHNYTDTPRDPYNAKRGFWYSHMGWMLSKETPVDEKKGHLLTKDLRKDPILMNQHNYYGAWAMASGMLLPTVIASLWGEAYAGFLFAGLFRTVMVHQYTFLINSAAHKWGKQTYGRRYSAKDNAILSFFTYGEGYHNFHHHFQNDYRNGIRWYDFDPTKWLIFSLEKLGLAHSLRTAPIDEIIRAKIDEDTRLLDLENIMAPFKGRFQAVHRRLENCSFRFREMQKEYNRLTAELCDEKDQRIRLLKLELQAIRREMRVSYRHWQKMVALLHKKVPSQA